MSKLKELTGSRFGNLLVVQRAENDPNERARWSCRCDCGVRKDVRSRHLMSGAVVSCGCLQPDRARANGRSGASKIMGRRHYRYRSDLTDEERTAGRKVPGYLEWRKAVLRACGYACDLCGKAGGRLVAHHLDSWALFPDSRFDVSNGVALCRTHHAAFHEGMGGNRVHVCKSDYEGFKAAWYSREAAEIHRGLKP